MNPDEAVILGHRCVRPSAAERALRRVERAFHDSRLDAAASTAGVAGAARLAADGLDRYAERLAKAVEAPGYLGPAGGVE